jgi:hypothetical protein
MYNRRDILRIGAAGCVTLPQLLRAQAQTPARATSIVQIYLPGGISHQDSWDYKVNGSSEYRGPFAPVKTKIDGVVFGELLKETAKVSDNLTVIRSMTHGEAAHERGTHNMLTGYKPSPALSYPSFGSVISHELGNRNNLPAYVLVPNQFAPENGTGYLSTKYGPFALGSNPEDPGFVVKDLNNPKDISDKQFDRRRSLLGVVDDHFKTRESNVDAIKAMDSFYNDAYSMLSSTQARESFELAKEPDTVRDAYGRNAAGQRLLLARRLVEAGVRMVTVTYGSWDHHSNLKSAYEQNMVNFDKAFATFINDLKQRGLLDSTLVMVTSEFGRTPKINNTNGRDHWPRVFSTVLAGGGVKAGYAYGTSDALASEPDLDPVTPQQFAATMYHLIGISPRTKLMTPDLRPVEVVYEAEPIESILA